VRCTGSALHDGSSQTVHQSVVNICSGREVSIRRLVEEIIAAMKLDEKQEMLSSLSAGPGRPDDIPWLVGNCARFEEWTGTKPQQISLAQTVASAVRESLQAPSQ
jgi:hypothetical protein